MIFLAHSVLCHDMSGGAEHRVELFNFLIFLKHILQADFFRNQTEERETCEF